jgi:hypothetical protein
MSCCLDLCLPNVGATMSPAALIWYSHATPDLPVLASSFSSPRRFAANSPPYSLKLGYPVYATDGRAVH